MKKNIILLFFCLLASMVSMAQTLNIIRGRYFYKDALAIPKDTLTAADSNSLAIKNNVLYYKALHWQSISGGGGATDTSHLSDRINLKLDKADTVNYVHKNFYVTETVTGDKTFPGFTTFNGAVQALGSLFLQKITTSIAGNIEGGINFNQSSNFLKIYGSRHDALFHNRLDIGRTSIPYGIRFAGESKATGNDSVYAYSFPQANGGGGETFINNGAGALSWGPVGEINTASNVGTGAGIWKDKTSVDLRFKSLVAEGIITITNNTNEIVISAPSSNATGSNGLNGTGTIKLGGGLTEPTSVTTDATNQLSIWAQTGDDAYFLNSGNDLIGSGHPVSMMWYDLLTNDTAVIYTDAIGTHLNSNNGWAYLNADSIATIPIVNGYIGSRIQAYDADLTTYAGITPSADVQTMLGSANNAAIRSNIGLSIGTNVQAYDADLSTWAGLTPTTVGQNLVTLTNPSAVGYIRTNADNTVTHRSYANTKVDLSLDNVENTALSTWAGSTNITTVGTIASGTWQGTAVADSYIASAATWNGKQAAYANLSSIGALANASGWLKNNGSGTFSYSTPTASDVGLGNVTNESKATMFTSPTFTGRATSNSINLGLQSIATVAGTTTLTNASVYHTIFTGTNTQNIDLPDATTLAAGQRYKVSNNSTGIVTVRTDGGATFWTMGASTDLDIVLTDAGTSAGTWEKDYRVGNSATGKVSTFNNSLTFSGTDGKGIDIGAATSGKILIGDGSNMILSTPTHPTAATLNKVIYGDGTNWVLSTPTIPMNAAPGSGKILYGDGTNYVLSTPTFPTSASATANKMIKSDGTNWVASTETFAAPGTSGNIATSDGTNWTSAANQGGWTSLRVSGSDFTTTSSSLVDITGLVTGTLSTATLYEFEAVLYVNSSTTAGMAVGVQQSGTGSGQIGVWSGSATNAAATGVAIGSNALNTAGAACVLVNGDGTISVRGFVKTGSSGSPTISFKCLKTTSGTAKVYIGSVLRYRVAS